MGQKAVINKIIPFSSVDGPGNRSVVFLQGCNFACLYCHNPETIGLCKNCGACVSLCPAGALEYLDGKVKYEESKCVQCDTCIHSCRHSSSPKTRELDPEQTMELIRGNMPYIRGITVSGGECTRWPSYLRELLLLAKREGLHTLLDSNGSYPFWEDKELLALCDGVMLDIKTVSDKLHRELTKASNQAVLKNLTFLAGEHRLYEVRTVVTAGSRFQAEETIKRTGEYLRPYLKEQSIRYKVIAYREMGVRAEYKEILRSPAVKELEALADLAVKLGFKEVIII